MRNIIVNKFGGTIIAEGAYRVRAREIVARQKREGLQPIVVVSAASGVTDAIEAVIRERKKGPAAEECARSVAARYEEMAAQSLGEEERAAVLLEIALGRKLLAADLRASGSDDGVSRAHADSARARGEKLSSILFAAYLRESGIAARTWHADRAGMRTTSDFGDADIIMSEAGESMDRLRAESELYVPVVTGFIGVDSEGMTTTLGRGGSDTTACFIGAALSAHTVILWKEVGCVLSADPSVVKDALPVARLSYAEAERAGKVICRKAVAHLEAGNVRAEVAGIMDKDMRTVLVRDHEDTAEPKIISKEWRPSDDADATVHISVVGGSPQAVLSSVARILRENRTPAEIVSFSRTSTGSDICMRVLHEETGNEIVRALHDEHIGGKGGYEDQFSI